MNTIGKVESYVWRSNVSCNIQGQTNASDMSLPANTLGKKLVKAFRHNGQEDTSAYL